MAERRFADYVRQLKARPETRLSEGLADPKTFEYGRALADALTTALKKLPEPQRRVVVMKLFEEKSFAEIADTLDIHEGAAKMRFSRGLARLRDDLRAQGLDP